MCTIANYDFLNMILFGVILNLIFVILSTKENVTNFDCKVLYFLKNYVCTQKLKQKNIIFFIYSIVNINNYYFVN